jgi:hypothetical protein
MSTNHFLPELATRLSQALSNAYSSPSPEKAAAWMEKAYAANNFDLNLNQLRRALLDAAGENQKIISDAFDRVVAQVLVHDKRHREQYLDTLWHFVSEGDDQRLFKLREQISAQLVNAEQIEHSSLNPKHCMMLYLLVDGHAQSELKYRAELAKQIYVNMDSTSVQECLDLMVRLKPESYSDLGNAYTAIHLDLKMPFGADEDELNLLSKLFPNPFNRMRHANAAMKRELAILKDLLSHNPQDPKTLLNVSPRQRIDNVLKLVGHALKPETLNFFLTNLTDSLRTAYSQDMLQVGDIADPQYEDAIKDIFQRLRQLTQGLDNLNTPWRDAFKQSFSSYRNPVNSAGTTYHQAAEKTLSNTHTHSPLLKLVALLALDELSTEQLVEQCAGNIPVLASLYKLTHNAELLPYLDGKARHACIEHDMGL